MSIKTFAVVTAMLTLVACTPSQPTKPEAPPAPPPPPAAPVAPPAQIGAWGVDLAQRDQNVKPGDDFYRYAIGHWLDSNQIPADRSAWGSFSALDDLSEKRVRGLVEALPAGATPGSAEQKVGDFYRAYMDTDAIEKAGLEPARDALKAIDSARSYEDIAKLIGRPELPLIGPIGIGISIDQKNPDRYSSWSARAASVCRTASTT